MSRDDSASSERGTDDASHAVAVEAEDTTSGAVVCTLSESEARERREMVKSELIPHLRDLEVADERITMTFDDEALETVATSVRLEHDCCSFAAFDLAVTPGDDPLELTVLGTGVERMFEEGLKPLLEEDDPSLLG